MAILQGCFVLLLSLVVVVYALEDVDPAAVVLAFLALAAAIGNLASGIVLMAKSRGRQRTAPGAVLVFAALPLVLGLVGYIGVFEYAIVLVFSAILSIPIFIVTGIGLAVEKRGR